MTPVSNLFLSKFIVTNEVMSNYRINISMNKDICVKELIISCKVISHKLSIDGDVNKLQTSSSREIKELGSNTYELKDSCPHIMNVVLPIILSHVLKQGSHFQLYLYLNYLRIF